jgi:hypothetical protein
VDPRGTRGSRRSAPVARDALRAAEPDRLLLHALGRLGMAARRAGVRGDRQSHRTRAHAARHGAGAGIVALASILQLGCGAAGDTPDSPHDAVLERVVATLELEPPVDVHPLVGQLERREDSNEFDLTSFYREDTLPVFDRPDGRYVKCRIARSGACELFIGDASVVLSEAIDIGNDAVMVIAFVTDLRSEGRAQIYFMAHARPGRSGWNVYRFYRM